MYPTLKVSSAIFDWPIFATLEGAPNKEVDVTKTLRN